MLRIISQIILVAAMVYQLSLSLAQAFPPLLCNMQEKNQVIKIKISIAGCALAICRDTIEEIVNDPNNKQENIRTLLDLLTLGSSIGRDEYLVVAITYGSDGFITKIGIDNNNDCYRKEYKYIDENKISNIYSMKLRIIDDSINNVKPSISVSFDLALAIDIDTPDSKWKRMYILGMSDKPFVISERKNVVYDYNIFSNSFFARNDGMKAQDRFVMRDEERKWSKRLVSDFFKLLADNQRSSLFTTPFTFLSNELIDQEKKK